MLLRILKEDGMKLERIFAVAISALFVVAVIGLCAWVFSGCTVTVNGDQEGVSKSEYSQAVAAINALAARVEAIERKQAHPPAMPGRLIPNKPPDQPEK